MELSEFDKWDGDDNDDDNLGGIVVYTCLGNNLQRDVSFYRRLTHWLSLQIDQDTAF